MLRRSQILTAVAVLAMCVVPGFAYGMPDQPVAPAQPVPPPSSIAESAGQSYSDLRSPDARDAAELAQLAPQVSSDLRTPDARDAAGDAPRVVVVSNGQDLRSPDAGDAARAVVVSNGQDLRSPDGRDAARPSPTAVPSAAPDSGTDWGEIGMITGAVVLALGGAGAVFYITRRRTRLHKSDATVAPS